MTTTIRRLIYEINTSQNDLVQKLYFCGPRKPIEIMDPGLRPSTLTLGYGGYPYHWA